MLNGNLTDVSLNIVGTLSSLGLRGFSAYELAVKQGFDGTLDEYLDSLKARIETKIEDNIIYYKYITEEEWYVLFDIRETQTELVELISKKVDKQVGKSLIEDSEIERLKTLENYNDKELRRLIEELSVSLSRLSNIHSNDIDEINRLLSVVSRDLDSLKLFFNDFRTAEDQDKIDARKANIGDSYTKSESDSKYQLKGDYLTEHQDITGKVDKVAGKGLSTNDYTNEEKKKLELIEEGANKYVLPLDVVHDKNYVHTDNNYTNTDKAKVDAIPSNPKYTDTIYNDKPIRLLITELSDKLNGIADSDDTTLDQLSEIVSYIKNNKSLIEGITTSKISYVDIIDNLVTNITNKPLSASQGVVLKGLIDELEDNLSSVESKIPTKMSELEQDVETGKIDSISVNGVEQEIDNNKNVNLEFVEHGLEYNEVNDSMKVHVLENYDDTEVKKGLDSKVDKSALMDAGIKNISWTTVRSEITVNTVEDIYKQYRPSGTNTRYWKEFDGCPYFKNRQLYRVTFNGTIYDNIVCDYGILVDDGTGSVIGSDTAVGGAWQLIGNKYLFDSRYEDTGEPFCIMYVEHGGMKTQGSYYYSSVAGNGILLTDSAITVTLKIEKANITQDELPKSLFNNYGYGDMTYQNIGGSTYPRTSLGQGNIVGRGSFAIGNSNVSTGQFALSCGADNVVSGTQAFVFGNNNNVSGRNAQAHGGFNSVTGEYALAFGLENENIGGASLTFGQMNAAVGLHGIAIGSGNRALTNESIAIGYSNTVDGNYNYGLAIGGRNNTSNNYCASVIGGRQNNANAYMSTVVGAYNTANEPFCFVSGMYNNSEQLIIGDNRNKYVHIVGNGTSNTARSNAHTLDWQGNAWYQGDIYVGGTSQTDPNAVKLLKSTDLPDITDAEIKASLGLEV